MKLESYLKQINETTRKLGVGACAFRGQGNAHWPLHSAATRRLRKHRGEGIQFSPEFPNLYLDYHKNTLLAPARTRGLGVESGREISELQLLSKLQHLGAATGLLDFSWSPLVGLWFACENLGEDGKLYVMNTNNPIQVAMISSDESKQGVSTLFHPNGEFPHIAHWEPMASGDAMARILRQRSVFIIGRPNIPEDSNIVGEITIAKEDKEELVRVLSLLDVSHGSLFLDAQGFAETNRVAEAVSLSQDDYLIAGNRYYQQGQYNYAIAAYGKFLDLNPNSYSIYFLRANAHAELRNHVEAIPDYDRAISPMTKFPQSILLDHMIYFNRANSKVELGDYKEALKDYLQAIAIAPPPEQDHYNLANTYADMSRFEEAISEYDKVTTPNWHVIFNKGNAMMCLGRLREAHACYLQAVALAPDDGTINQNLWTSSTLLNMLDGIQFAQRLDDAHTRMQICVSERVLLPEFPSRTYIMAGRAGNKGNIGYMHSGGQGFGGKGPILINISTCSAKPG